MDSKSIGLCPQGFESPRSRFRWCLSTALASIAPGRSPSNHLRALRRTLCGFRGGCRRGHPAYFFAAPWNCYGAGKTQRAEPFEAERGISSVGGAWGPHLMLLVVGVVGKRAWPPQDYQVERPIALIDPLNDGSDFGAARSRTA